MIDTIAMRTFTFCRVLMLSDIRYSFLERVYINGLGYMMHFIGDAVLRHPTHPPTNGRLRITHRRHIDMTKDHMLNPSGSQSLFCTRLVIMAEHVVPVYTLLLLAVV